MADNISVTPGTGRDVSTEEVTDLNGVTVAGVHVQRVGLALISADATAADISASNPLAVSVSGGATAANQVTANTSLSGIDTKLGSLTETAPATDTASSGLNGRMQRIAQRLTSLIALLPTSLGQKAKAASLAVTLASDEDPMSVSGGVASAATDSGNPVKVGGKYNSSLPTFTDGQRGDLQIDSQGSLRVNPGNLTAALDTVTTVGDLADDAAFTPGTSKVRMVGFTADESSTDSIDEGDGGAARMTLDRKVIVNPQPHSAGGLSIFRSIDLDEGTLEVVKASPGCVYGMWVTNQATATRWIKFYDAVSGTAGTGTPVITIGIPGNSSDDISGAFGPGGVGIQFSTGICVGAVTAVADNDTGAPSANDVVVNIFYR